MFDGAFDLATPRRPCWPLEAKMPMAAHSVAGGEPAYYALRKRSASHDSMSSRAALAIAVVCNVKPWGDSG